MSHWRRYTPIVVLLAGVSSTHADAYPTRPIRLVAPFPAGGTADVLARQVSTEVSTHLGQSLHLAAELFNVRTGVKLLHVPYKGVAPAMNAVLGGEVQATFMPATIAVGHVKAGKLKAIAFTGASRWSGMPELPTMKEQGVANLELTGSWHGWFAPAKTTPAILSRLHREVHKVLQTPRVRETIVAGGYEPDGRSPAEFRKFLRQEYDRYGEMVRVANVPKE